ncbi:MAG: glycosyltransferase family 2 protein [Bacteroidales bacterium]|nr:glycosyltransferase family 2 protein [Bacteroidales bacterium]
MEKLSIIIVNYKGWEPLKECLDSLTSLKAAEFDSEVIVVDNFSNDGNLKKFMEYYPDILFIENKGNYGFSNGNNLGARYATGEYLLFLNPDTIVTTEPLLSMLYLAEQNPGYFIVSSQQINPAGRKENPFNVFPSFWTINNIIKIFYLLFTGKVMRRLCNEHAMIFPDWVSGSVIMMRRKVFQRLGGWDEDFWLYSEDVDLCKRARDAGGVVALQCSPPITHKHGGTTRSNIRLSAFFKAHVIISTHIYFRKHSSGKRHFLLQAFLVINTMILKNFLPALLGMIFFPFNFTRQYLFIYFYLLKYYSRSLKNRSWFLDPKHIVLPEKK